MLLIRFKVEEPDKYIICPVCGNVGFIPRILLKEKTVEYHSPCGEYWFDRSEIK